MKRIFHVINSDAINLYSERITPGALITALYENNVFGLPVHIAHDLSRFIGWSIPQTIYFEPGLTRVIDSAYLFEKDDEHKEFEKRRAHLFYSHIQGAPETTYLRQELQGYLSPEAKLIATECTAFVDPGLTYRVFSNLKDLQDPDGLISLNELQSIGPGIFRIGELAIFAHHFFRRNLFRLNTLNYPFLKQLQKFTKKQYVPRIALDPDMVGLVSTYNGEKLELQYWWGPKFDDKLENIPVGVTCHVADETQKFFYGVSRTEFRWGSQASKHIFEAEELRDLPTRSEDIEKYGCRYVHSIVNEFDGRVEHLDGSIRTYTETEMVERLDIDIAHAQRKTEYTKLWRFDAPIVSVWKNLISDYFRDNFLVGEYLGAEKLDRSIWKPEAKQSPLESQYIPYSFRPEDGLRISVTFMVREDTAKITGQSIIPNDYIGDEFQNSPYIESDSIEVKKAFDRVGISLEMDNSVQFVCFKDKYLNIPVIVFTEENLSLHLDAAFQALKLLLDLWAKKDIKNVISFTFKYPIDQNRDVQVSVIGWVTELQKWILNPLSHTPTNAQDWYDWADKVSEYLRENYPENIDRIPIFSLLQSTGILLIKRERIEYEEFHQYSDNQGKKYEIKFSKEMEPISEYLINQGIVPGFAFIIVKGRCSKCGNSYFQCNCSKLLDQGVKMVINEVIQAFPFWTDKPVPIIIEK